MRQVSFIYLDSFNSDFSFHIDITKILLNPYNNKTLFNPNSLDYNSFFDSCETTLTKKVYITEKAASSLEHNKQTFKDYISKEIRRNGSSKLNLEDFLCSLYSRNVKPFEITSPPETFKCLQFYISKDDLEIFGIKREFFNYQKAQRACYDEIAEFNSILNKNLTDKVHKVCLIHDGRKTLYFNNLLIDFSRFYEVDQIYFIQNYLNVHFKYLVTPEYIGITTGSFKKLATINLRRHYSRKVFLQLLKILFNYNHDLSAYIKYDNHQLIRKESRKDPSFHATGFVQSKSKFLSLLEDLIGNVNIPKDLKNNHRIAYHILQNVTSIKRYVKIFYCFFPIIIDEYELDPSKLYMQQNPESAKTVTDIDLMFAIFNKGKFELYIVEGKDKANGFQAATINDFNGKIKPNLRFPNLMPNIEIVNEAGAKGGYICYKN